MGTPDNLPEELATIASMPFASKDWFLRLRMPDGTIVPAPLVPEAEFVSYAKYYHYGLDELIQVIRYVADISPYDDFQQEFQRWTKAMQRCVWHHNGNKCLTTLHVIVARQRAHEAPGSWDKWNAVLHWNEAHGGSYGVSNCDPILAYGKDEDAGDPAGVLSRLGIIDGESMARMMRTWNYDWSPETQSWAYRRDYPYDKPWWMSLSEWDNWYLPRFDCGGAFLDSWILADDLPEPSDNGESQLRRAASRYRHYEEAYEQLVRDGKKVTGATLGMVTDEENWDPSGLLLKVMLWR